jgi:hypothetical protein
MTVDDNRGQATAWPLSWLQLNRLNLSNKASNVFAEERSNHTKYRIAEATNVQNIRPVRRLRRGVRLQVDAHQLGAGVLASLQTDLVLYELLAWLRRWSVRRSQEDAPAGGNDWRGVLVPFVDAVGQRGSPRTTRVPAARSNSRSFAAIAVRSYSYSRAKLSRQARNSAKRFRSFTALPPHLKVPAVCRLRAARSPTVGTPHKITRAFQGMLRFMKSTTSP